LLKLALLAVLCSGYGYGPDQDPFVLAFKTVAASARDGRWEEAQRSAQQFEGSLVEIQQALGANRRSQLSRSLARRDAAALAGELTTLAYLQILLKFHFSQSEGLDKYYSAKYRIEAARGYYLEMLAPAVRKADAQRQGRFHATILPAFDDARAALGSPGFLGRGRTAPEPERFAKAARTIERTLREVFPSLATPDIPTLEDHP
jgi:hypothetical protein